MNQEDEDFDKKEKLEEVVPQSINNAAEVDDELDPVALNKAFIFASWSSVALLVIMIILIPLPLFFASTVYSKGGLTVWVIVGIAWTFCSAIAVVLYPLWESRAALTQIVRGIVKDIFTMGGGKYVAPTTTAAA